MKNLSFKPIFYICLLAVLFITSQSFLKKYDILKRDSIVYPLVKNNTIIFENSSQFSSIMYQISTFTELQKLQWEKNIGFISCRHQVDSTINQILLLKTDIEKQCAIQESDILELTTDSTVTSKVNDPFFADIANQNGEFVIGKNLYKIANDSMFIIKDYLTDYEHYDLMPSSKKDIDDSISIKFKETLSSNCNSTSNQIIVTKNTLRVRHEIYVLNWQNANFLWVVSQSQQKISGLWFAYKTNHNMIVTDIKVSRPMGVFSTGSFNKSGTNVKEVTNSWTLATGVSKLTNYNITLVNSKTQTQGVYPYWAEINCQ